MYAMYALAFLMMIFTYSVYPAKEEAVRLDDASTVVARQMFMYHQAALNVCQSGGCPSAGQISVVSINANLNALTNAALTNQFRSYTNGSNRVVTVIASELAGAEIDGGIAGKLIEFRGDDKLAGVYDWTDQTIGYRDSWGLVVPRNIGGVALRNGMNILGNQY